MARRDLSKYDASDRASLELEYIIKDRKQQGAEQEKTISVEKAISDKRVLKSSDNRNVTRVLFISRDSELLNPAQQTLDGYLNISDLFAEVHILILRPGIPTSKPVLRVAPNVWLYTATAKVWWKTPKAGVKLVTEQLEFANGFRPDLIVARDPFESALVAKELGKKYQKPTQLHILDDYTSEKFANKDKDNFWRKFILFSTSGSFPSIRTATSKLHEIAAKRFHTQDLQELPKFNNYEALIEQDGTLDLKEIYKPFVFFMLYVGNLDQVKDVFTIMDSTRSFLINPRIGLLIVGDGKEKNEIKKRAKLLGIEQQVIVESREVDVTSYLKSGNILFVSQTSPESEELVLKGAAAGIPMIMSRTEKREDLFRDKEDALLCDAGDQVAFAKSAHDLIENVGMRAEFVRNSQEIIRQQFHTDPKAYQSAYRESIEQALFIDENAV
jgi:glycosyltransferase involved in cell wall biosynthesis